MELVKFVEQIMVIDPDTKGEVDLTVFKHSNGGMFAIDSSFLEQCFGDDEDIIIPDLFSNNDVSKEVEFILLTGNF